MNFLSQRKLIVCRKRNKVGQRKKIKKEKGERKKGKSRNSRALQRRGETSSRWLMSGVASWNETKGEQERVYTDLLMGGRTS